MPRSGYQETVSGSALVSALAALVPTPAARERNRRRVRMYGPERFASYRDYFWFGHVDPVLRWWHAIGMVAGVVLFPLAVLLRDPLLFLAGVVFFYGLGYVSHVIYDGGAARTDYRYFLPSIPWIIEINLRTLGGGFEPCLRDLAERYPFVRQAYGLDPGVPAAGADGRDAGW
jgi:hypothetical protein